MSKPKIFISWSGKDTASFRVASKLNDILPLMFQNADYFFSDHITKGKPGIDKVFCNLAEAKIGIFCITKENILKPWLNSEAGAVASAVNNNGLAIPLLINMDMNDFTSSSSPLANFQGTVFKDENDLRRMIQDIREAVNSDLSEKQVDGMFSLYKGQLYDCDISDDNCSTSNTNNVCGKKVSAELPWFTDLRKIISKYHDNGERNNISTYELDISKESIAILEDKRYIEVISRFRDGHFSLRLLGKAFEFEQMNQ